MFNSRREHLTSKACVLFSNSAVKVHDSQAYRNIEMTKERISFTFDQRDILLSLQKGFSFVRSAVACAILNRTYIKFVVDFNFIMMSKPKYIVILTSLFVA